MRRKNLRAAALALALAIGLLALGGCAGDPDPSAAQGPEESAGQGSPAPTSAPPESPQPSPGPEETEEPDDTGAPVETGEPAPADPAVTNAPTQTPAPSLLPEDYDFSAAAPEGEAVEDGWFADAVFIGDSRTDGLRLYSGIRSGDFLSYKGLTVFKVEEEACIPDGEGSITVLEALGRKEYAKVYLMLGVNELGYPGTNTFKNSYAQLVDQIRAIQPNAVIYIQTLPAVNEEVGREAGMASYITNDKIVQYNAILAEIAQEKEAVLVNVAEALVDESGVLPADMTSDGVHMKRAGYETWYAYLRTHTGVQ